VEQDARQFLIAQTMSQREKKTIQRIAERVDDFLRTEIALTDLVKPGLTKAQRQRIYGEICRRARVVLLG